MDTKKLLTSVAVAAALSTVGLGAAHAAVDKGFLTFDSDGIATFNATYVANTSFDDIYKFTLSSVSDIYASAYPLAAKVKTTFSDILLYSVSTSGTATKLAETTAISGDEVFVLNQPATGISYYYFEVKGTIPSKSTGYLGSVSITPVPEPESYAMLLAGLGLMGTIARRRNKAKAS